MMATRRDDREGSKMATKNDGTTTIVGDTAAEKLAADARREREES